MRSQVTYHVVGKHESGERVVLTKNTTREIAERIVNLMKADSAFAELFIEAEGDEETE
jgi:hypothetical protein